MSQPALVEIDLNQTTTHGGSGLGEGSTYLVLYRGELHCGKFYRQWYGLNFAGICDAGVQYDPPGTNLSSWQRIWRIDNANQIAEDAKIEYKRSRRAYAISAKLISNGQRIDESAPLAAFGYSPTIPPMPKIISDEDGDY